MSDNLPPLPPACESLSKWTYDAADMRAYALAAIEADRVSRDVPAGWKLVPVMPTAVMCKAAIGLSTNRNRWYAMLAASPQPQPLQAGDATGAVNETNAVLASRYFDLLKVVESYEAHGVTCQTFRHFVDQPCAECNCTTQPVQPSQYGSPELQSLILEKLAQPVQAQPSVCTWTYQNDDSGNYESSCGELWHFIDGGPNENRVTYCHHCGKPVDVKEE